MTSYVYRTVRTYGYAIFFTVLSAHRQTHRQTNRQTSIIVSHFRINIKQRQHIIQAHRVLVSLDPIRSALMRACAGQCGLDSSCYSTSTVEAVVSLDHPGLRNGDEASESALF